MTTKTPKKSTRVVGNPLVPPNLYARFLAPEEGETWESKVIALVVVEEIDPRGEPIIFLSGFIDDDCGTLIHEIYGFLNFIIQETPLDAAAQAREGALP